MKTIDFLPEKYREATAQRRAQGWRIAVLAVFVALVGLASIVQMRRRGVLEQELVVTRLEFDRATAESQRLAERRLEIPPLRAQADLVTYLAHPWPRTQILALVFGSLPDEVKLARVHVGRVQRRLAPTDVPPPTAAPLTTAAPSGPPAEQDFARLRQEVDVLDTVVQIEGVASDVSSLHAWLGRLAKEELLTDVQLASIENSSDSAATGSQFSLRLVVRPGYGQSGGPAPLSPLNDLGSSPGLAQTAGEPSP